MQRTMKSGDQTSKATTRAISRRMVAAIAIVAALSASPVQAGLIYWQNFDSGDGAPDAPSDGIGGALGISNATGATSAFSSSGGIFGGSYDASSNSTPGGAATSNALASTGATGGTSINLGTLSKLTLTMWIKTDTLPTASANQAARLMVLGASGVTDVQVANSLSLVMRPANPTGKTNTVQILSQTLDPTLGGIGSSPGDSVLQGQWTFLALTYDGTSFFGNDSADQSFATGGLSSINGQYYRGSDTSSVMRTAVPLTVTAGNASAASQGPFNFGSAGVVFLAGRPTGGRQFDGWVDDVRIYDTVLSASSIENVRQQGLLGIVPEPSSLSLMTSAGYVGLVISRKRRSLRRSKA